MYFPISTSELLRANTRNRRSCTNVHRLKRYYARDCKPDVSWVIARSRSFKEGGETSTLPKNATEEAIPKPNQPVRSTCRPAVLKTSDETCKPKVTRKKKKCKEKIPASQDMGAPPTAPATPVKRPQGRPPGKAKPKQPNSPPRSAPVGVRRSKRGKPTE